MKGTLSILIQALTTDNWYTQFAACILFDGKFKQKLTRKILIVSANSKKKTAMNRCKTKLMLNDLVKAL